MRTPLALDSPRHFTQKTMVLVILALLLLASPSPIRGVTTQSDVRQSPDCDPEIDYMEQIRSSFIDGDYSTAETAATCAIALDTNNENLIAYLWQGGLAAANEDYDPLATNLYLIINFLSTENSPLQTTIAREIPTIKTAIDSRPADFVPYLLRGIFLWSVGLEPTARMDWKHLIKIAPDNQVGYLFDAVWITDTDVAVDEFLTGVNLAPDSTLIDWVIGYYFPFMASNIESMIDDYPNQTIENNPDHPFAYLVRGLASVYRDDMERAARDFYQHIQINQRNLSDHLTLTVGDSLELKEAPVFHVYQLSFSAEQGQVLNLNISRGNHIALLPNTLVILNADGEVLAAPYEFLTGHYCCNDIGIRRFEVPETGTYTILFMENDRAPVTVRLIEARN